MPNETVSTEVPAELHPTLDLLRKTCASRRLMLVSEPAVVRSVVLETDPDETILGSPMAVFADLRIVWSATLGGDTGFLSADFSGCDVDAGPAEALLDAVRRGPVLRYWPDAGRDPANANKILNGQMTELPIYVALEAPDAKRDGQQQEESPF